MKYKNEWKSNSKNVDFWTEVLVGRTIESISFDDTGVASLVLDSGEKVTVLGDTGRLSVELEK